MERYVWSLDISTTNIGSTLMNTKGKLIELKHLELKLDKDIPVENRYIFKAEMFREYVTKYKERILNELNGEIIQIILEAPLGGSINPTTAALLFGFNGICSYILYKIFDIYPQKISVYDSRRLFLNELVKISHKKNKKTGKIETIETLSFPPKYIKEKKLYIWEKVCKLEPQIKWFYKKNTNEPKDMCFDMADSYCCCYSGMRKFGILE